MSLLVGAVWAAAAVGLHEIGSRRGWYESQGGFWWFDHLTHSVSAGALMYLLLRFLDFTPAIGAFAALAILWEIGEYFGGGRPGKYWHNARNMVYDLAFGLLAALLVGVVV